MNVRTGNRLLTAYDVVAPGFDRHRALPDGVTEAIRAAILETVHVSSPRLLDLGAGSGRIGAPFVAAGDDYVGYHSFMALMPAFDMSRELPEERRALPVLKVRYRNTRRMQDVGGSFRSIRDTAAHMLGAEIVWYMRWQGESPSALPPAANGVPRNREVSTRDCLAQGCGCDACELPAGSKSESSRNVSHTRHLV